MSKDTLPHKVENTIDSKSSEALPDLFMQMEEQLSWLADRGGKIRLHNQGMKALFLPSAETASYFIFGKSGFLKNIEMIEEKEQLPLNISRSGRYDLIGKKGVAARSATKLISWLKSVIPPTLFTQDSESQQVSTAIKVGSNAADWLMVINSFEKGFKSSGTNESHEFYPLFDYINKRCEADIFQCKEATRQITTSNINETDLSAAWLQYKPLWLEHSLVSEDRLNEFTEVLGHMSLNGQQVDKTLMTDTEKLTFFRGYFTQYFDFYFGAISSYEVGCVLFYADDIEVAKSKQGILCRSLITYATDPAIKSCFGALLLELEIVVEELVGAVGKRKIASFIPVQPDTSKEESFTLKQKQYDRLKSWRSGRASPSDEVLRQFLGNLAALVGKNNGDAILFLCRITISLDKEIKQFLKLSKKDYAYTTDVERELMKVFSTYEDYYQSSLNFWVNR
jgi:hypothetical protein